MKMNDESPTCWHALTVEQVFAALDTSPKEISESAVAARLRLHGPNGTHGPPPTLGMVCRELHRACRENPGFA